MKTRIITVNTRQEPGQYVALLYAMHSGTDDVTVTSCSTSSVADAGITRGICAARGRSH